MLRRNQVAKKKKYRKTPPRRVRPPFATPAGTASSKNVGDSPGQPTRFAARSAPPRDWAYEYRYVITDLRRMAFTTVAMFALLFVLAIVVPLVLR